MRYPKLRISVKLDFILGYQCKKGRLFNTIPFKFAFAGTVEHDQTYFQFTKKFLPL